MKIKDWKEFKINESLKELIDSLINQLFELELNNNAFNFI
jgi:hypothetical protein